MADDNSEERDPATFSPDLNASEMLALNTILQDAVINYPDEAYAAAAKGIGRKIIKEMATEDFNEAIEEEMNIIEEREEEMLHQLESELGGRGVQ